MVEFYKINFVDWDTFSDYVYKNGSFDNEALKRFEEYLSDDYGIFCDDEYITIFRFAWQRILQRFGSKFVLENMHLFDHMPVYEYRNADGEKDEGFDKFILYFPEAVYTYRAPIDPPDDIYYFD